MYGTIESSLHELSTSNSILRVSHALKDFYNACNRMSKRRMQVMAIIHWKGCLLRAIEQRMKTNIRAACIKLERQILTRLFNWSFRKSFCADSDRVFSREKEISRKGMDRVQISPRPMEDLTKNWQYSTYIRLWMFNVHDTNA